MSYEFVVISISNERKMSVIQQFKDLCIDKPLQFLENPATLLNSQDYFPNDLKDEYLMKVVCCARSHLRAIEYACREDASEYSVICEDDIAVHKTQFINGIEEIISTWDTCISPDKIASIGWVPCNNYQTYINAPSKHTLKSIVGSKILHDRYVPGLQAYIIRKKDILPFVKHLIKPTLEELRTSLHSLNLPDLSKDNSLIAVDYFLNRIFGQAIVFPPIVIEKTLKSLLGHNNVDKYWNIFFKDFEYIKKNYYLE
jgi:GR25 family glycosyltransferase involved in LPS biosynthesis